MQRCEYAAVIIELVRWEVGVGVGTTGRSWSKGGTRQREEKFSRIVLLSTDMGLFPEFEDGNSGLARNIF